MRHFSWLGTIVLVVGCGPTPKVGGPIDVTQRYLRAAADGKSAQAWDLLSPDARRSITQIMHRKHIENLSEVTRQQMRKAVLSSTPQVLTVTWKGGERASGLVMEYRGAGAWVVISHLPEFDKLDTPLNALKTFRNAVVQRRYNLLLKLAPTSERHGITVTILKQRFAKQSFRSEILKAVTTLLSGGPDRRMAPTRWRFEAGRHVAIFVLEAGKWRLLDVR